MALCAHVTAEQVIECCFHNRQRGHAEADALPSPSGGLRCGGGCLHHAQPAPEQLGLCLSRSIGPLTSGYTYPQLISLCTHGPAAHKLSTLTLPHAARQ